MGTDIKEPPRKKEAPPTEVPLVEKVTKVEADRTDAVERVPLQTRMTQGLSNVRWGVTLLTALIMAVGWCFLFLSSSILQILAGVVPVVAGLYLGRRVTSSWLTHGIILGLSGFVFGLVFIGGYGLLSDAGIVPVIELARQSGQPPAPVNTAELVSFYLAFSAFALIPFPAFGTVMAGRTEQRNREMREQIETRGGKLERPGSIRTLEDVRGLSLPQLGTYVSDLYRKKGFTFVDYRFVDKDKHLDLELEYEDETYLVRMSVADKVRPGTLEGLVQEMKRRGIAKGIAIASTEFTPDALKSASGRKNLVAVDGEMLFDMVEN